MLIASAAALWLALGVAAAEAVRRAFSRPVD